MRVAVVGAGSIGRRHIGNLLALGCEVSAFDVSETARAAVLGQFPGQVRCEDRLSFDRVDALVIATPWDQHLVWVEEAIRRRIPFLVEKPLGSLDQLPRWREIAAMNLGVNQVGYMLRFHPIIVGWKRSIRAAHNGLFSVECDSSRWPGRAYGPMMLECSHEIDLALWFGAPDHVAGVSAERIPSLVGVIKLGLDDRWMVRINDRATFYIREWKIEGDGCPCVTASFDAPKELGDEMYRDELAHFLDCVRDQKPTVTPLADGLRVLELCQQVEQMARQTA